MRVVVSELSSRSNVRHIGEALNVKLTQAQETETLQHIKDAEARGMSYESAEASVALLIHRKTPGYQPLFHVIDYGVTVGKRRGSQTYSEATIKLEIGSEVMHTAAEGNGPVSALDAALRKALVPLYPEVDHIHLADYKVRILDTTDGTGATTRVLIDSRDAHRAWTTVGASANIIEASLAALIDSIEYGLLAELGTGPREPRLLDGRPSERPRSASVPPPPRIQGVEAK
jgi:2-isopropylmalate synthase